ncbi:MAG TPA: hypothetical protein VGM32_20860 [Rhodopila sp.]
MDAGELRHVEFGLEKQLTSVGRGIPVSARQVADGFVTQCQGQIDALLLQLGPAEITEQIRPCPDIIGLGIRNGRSLRPKIGRMRSTARQK